MVGRCGRLAGHGSVRPLLAVLLFRQQGNLQFRSRQLPDTAPIARPVLPASPA